MAKPHVLRFVEREQGKHRCHCGCDALIPITNNHYFNGIPRFIHGHNQGFYGTAGVSVDEWIAKEQGRCFCHCGCGGAITIRSHHHSNGIPKYLPGHHSKFMVYPGDEERFWKFVRKSDSSDGCWSWLASKAKCGYGHIRTRHPTAKGLAHRLSYIIHNGDFDPVLDVLHECDNPECTNPAHLFLGTHKDNMVDAAKKGRFKAKLTRETVVEAVSLVQAGHGLSETARKFGVTPPTLWAAVRGITWSHATGIQRA